ncbi:MAG: host-nuclease inhibitor Gam family protein [bacterium]|nr:host-nuclease inhibitor Gam family protein [bacterium]
MAKTKNLKKKVIEVPKDLVEAASFIKEIGDKQREINKIQDDLNAKIEELKEQAVNNSIGYQKIIETLMEGLFAYANANREELTDNGKKKTVNLPTGTLAWRMTPPSVILRKVDEVIKALKQLKLDRFIRTKEEVDKEAMLKEPEVAKTVSGVTISQHEEFSVKPAEAGVEITEKVDKLKKVLA